MIKKIIVVSFAAVALLAAGVSNPAFAGSDDDVHKLVMHVTKGDKKTLNIAINNAVNVTKYYGLGNVEVEIVANGPGLAMFHKSSPVQKRLQYLHSLGNIKFGVCNNTMKKKKYTKADLLPDAFVQASIVPAGVVRVMELQEKGWSYVRP